MSDPGRQTPNGFDLRGGTTDAEAVASYYDDWSESYDATLEAWNYTAPDDAAALMLPHLAPGARVVDVGCGTGLFGAALGEKIAARLDGIDISEASLELARRRGGYESLAAHDLNALPLPFADDSADGAASVGVLTYLDDASALLRDLCRVVRPGGVIAFTQRDDRWRSLDFGRVVEGIAADGLWEVLEIGEPRAYLPGNADFGDEIRVIHTLARVL